MKHTRFGWTLNLLMFLHVNLTKPPSSHSYLRAAVWCGWAPIEVILGQEEGRVGHVQDGVVHQHHLTEVELVGETLSFGFV